MVKANQLSAVHVPGAQQATVLPRQVTSMPATSVTAGQLGGLDVGELISMMITMMIIVMIMKMMTGAMTGITA